MKSKRNKIGDLVVTMAEKEREKLNNAMNELFNFMPCFESVAFSEDDKRILSELGGIIDIRH